MSEVVGVKGNNQAWIIIEALNFDRRSFPGIGVGHFGSMRKECRRNRVS